MPSRRFVSVLSATPERDEFADALLEEIVGKFVFRLEAQELAGEYLADYTVERIEVDLSDEERANYQRERAIYTDFKRRKNLPYGQEGWRMFLIHSARSEEGRRAMKAYRNQKKIALGTDSKIRVLQDLLTLHKHDKTLIFTAENEMVYQISKDYLIPAITHETNVKERKFWLDAFNKGDVLALGNFKSLERRREYSDASVVDNSFRFGFKPRTYSAFGKNFAKKRRQTGDSLRSRRTKHERRIHFKQTLGCATISRRKTKIQTRFV